MGLCYWDNTNGITMGIFHNEDNNDAYTNLIMDGI